MAHSESFESTIAWYDTHAAQYAEAGASYADPNHIRKFVEMVTPGGRVLDAGCGAGRDTVLLSEQGLHVVGLDISDGLLAYARHRFPELEFVHGDLRKLQFGNESFDGVWSNTSIVHLETVEEVDQALSEMNRVLVTGGTLHIVVKSQTGKDKTAVVADKLSGHNRFFQYFTQDELHRLLVKAEFEIVSLEEYDETETIPHGRADVRIIWGLARKAGVPTT
jgi:ubiquinone/menaquinone biosynthesis C-methylase UbiE